MNKSKLLIPLSVLVMLCGCSSSPTETTTSAAETTTSAPTAATTAQTTETAPEPAQPKGGFHVEGTKLLDANGNEFIMRGINHAHSWFRGHDAEALSAIADTGANCVRIVLADGDRWEYDSADVITGLIDQCRANKMIAIVEVHDATGSNDTKMLQSAADYWIQVKKALIGTEDCVILNIANEWVGKWESNVWREGYTEVIPELREAGIKNTIMVDAAGWGQYGKSIADAGMAVFESDPDANTMFSIHMYGSAGKNPKQIEDNLTGVTSQELCVCVGEFGYMHSDGDVDEGYIMQYCTENDIGYLGWSWKGNGGGVEYLDLSETWDGSVLSPDWGEVLINGEYGIKATSKPCTIFEDVS